MLEILTDETTGRIFIGIGKGEAITLSREAARILREAEGVACLAGKQSIHTVDFLTAFLRQDGIKDWLRNWGTTPRRLEALISQRHYLNLNSLDALDPGQNPFTCYLPVPEEPLSHTPAAICMLVKIVQGTKDLGGEVDPQDFLKALIESREGSVAVIFEEAGNFGLKS